MSSSTPPDMRALAEAMPQLVWMTTADGWSEYYNARWSTYTGLPDAELLGYGWLDAVHPADRERATAAWQGAVAARTLYETDYRLRRHDGVYRWMLARGVPVRDADGTVVRWIGTTTDVDDNKRAEAEFRALADAMPQIVFTSVGGRNAYLNERWSEYTGIAAQDGVALGWSSVLHPDDVAPTAERWQRSERTGEPFEIEYRFRRHDGVYRWFLGRAEPFRDERGAIAKWFGTCTDIDDRKRSEQREAFVAELTRRLADTLDVDEATARLAGACIPLLADRATVYLAADDKLPQVAALRTRDDAGAARSRALRQRFPVRAHEPVARVIASAQPLLFEVLDRVQLDAAVGDDAALRTMLRELGTVSCLLVPMLGRDGRALGALVLSYDGSSGRHYAPADLPLAEEIAARGAVAVANALRYQREHRVSDSFQNAALPPSLPRVRGLHLSARYEAGRSEALVGGDWYDAFRLPDGRLVLSVGDVAGNGLDAAVTMGSVRQSIRTAAVINPDAVVVLDAVDRIVRAMDHEKFVTAFVAVFDPLDGELRYASAGHPPPLLRAPDGTVTTLAGGDLPLGLRQRSDTGPALARMAPGSLLVLYTDGLTEVDRDPLAGERVVVAALAATVPAGDVASCLYDVVTAGRAASDDVAVLALAFYESPPALRRRFASGDGNAAREARLAFVEALHDAGLSQPECDAAELVFGELIGNVVRYAAGELEATLDLSGNAPVLNVVDAGAGFELNPRLPADVFSERGRGLFIVTTLADDLTISRRPDGGSHARAVLRGRIIVAPLDAG